MTRPLHLGVRCLVVALAVGLTAVGCTSSDAGSEPPASTAPSTAPATAPPTASTMGTIPLEPTQVAARVPLSEPAWGVAATRTDAWVTVGEALERVDAATDAVTATVPIGGPARGLALSRGEAWVACACGEVVRVDLAKRRVVGRTRTGTSPWGVAAGGGAVWVVDIVDNTLSKLDPATGRRTLRVRLEGSPRAVVARGGSVWLILVDVDTITGEELTGLVQRLDARTGKVLASADTNGSPRAIATGPTGTWVTTTLGELTHFDPSTLRMVATGHVTNSGRGLALTGNSVLVSDVGGDEVLAVDAGTLGPFGKVSQLGGPDALALSGRSLWVTTLQGPLVRLTLDH